MKRLANVIGALQLMVVIGAIPAGLSLIFTPNGSGIGLSLNILEGTPFKDFLIPGIFLLFMLGGINLIGALFSFTNKRCTGPLSMFSGIILMLWISIQVYFIGLNHFLQPTFLFIGVLLFGLGLKHNFINKQEK